MTFFQDHSQKRAQWQPKRRNGATASGTTVIHTYEAPAGRTARQGADYFLTRDNPASYHYLCDALGGALQLAPWSAETWHDTASNNWSVGISMMTRAADWPDLTDEQRDHLVHGAALGAHRYSRWRVSQGLAPVPARRITREQAMRREAGFIEHGEMDPGRRSDPGKHFPWEQFLTYFRRLESGTNPSEEDDMSQADVEQVNDYLDQRIKDLFGTQTLRQIVAEEVDRAGGNITRYTDRRVTDLHRESFKRRDEVGRYLDHVAAAAVGQVLAGIKAVPGVDAAAIERAGDEAVSRISEALSGMTAKVVLDLPEHTKD
ncbi:N-acetylmuramoyl-L-alanine amidase [Litorihabitans aurantiacus]|uniref:N-acetylmuramoyl-L-alanine amidase domain-containing protein n=1 Tax=Litorihabitans aurantiacus TaxID=1930061 RepID=A0AA38CTT9_9MICO|nr:N-acetylmuramoyl-L-alanine amidase [Litorihabitans aurantiacus]GMA31615.1 hypothetical protein GCM10025875_16070 [Litorihabitans aurantiacus]